MAGPCEPCAAGTTKHGSRGDSDKASPAHPAPPATTAAAKEARESDEDAVTSRAATPDKKKEVAKVIATKKHESSTPNTTQTAREDTPTMTARTDEKGELHTTATSTKTASSRRLGAYCKV